MVNRYIKERLLGIVSVLVLISGTGQAEFKPDEALVYPGGFSTADVLHHREWLVAPIPYGWLAYGITSHLTVGWDYPMALVGNPAGLLRYQFRNTGDVEYAIEGYGTDFTKNLDDSRSKGYRLEHQGTQDFIRLERSARLNDRWRWHAYAGANYASYSRYETNEKVVFEPVTYRRHFNPDAGVALEWDVRPWLKMNLNYVYGNTFVFVDQVALKHMIVGSLLFAPFTHNNAAWLRNFRFDLTASTVNVPIAHYTETLPVPIYPTIYWQWGGSDD